MPRPKVSEAAIAEARRLNELDSKREAIELDEEGAVIDDLEERRKRWRRWCGLSKVIVMQSAEPVVRRHQVRRRGLVWLADAASIRRA